MNLILLKSPAVLSLTLTAALFLSTPARLAAESITVGVPPFHDAGLLAQAEAAPAPQAENTPPEPADVETVQGKTEAPAMEQPGPPDLPPGAPGTTPVETRKAKTGAAPKPAAGGPVSFFFEDADIFDVMQTVFGDILKSNYIIDQRVKGKVTFRTVNPIPREEVLTIMEIVLRLNGIGFVEEKGLYRILPLTEVSNELVYAQMGKKPESVAIELFVFKNLNVRDSLTDIENAVGISTQVGKVRIVPIYRLNAILAVASQKEHIEYVRKWIQSFEIMFADAKPKVMVYPLQNSKAAHVASMLQSIIGGGGGGAPAPAPATRPTTPTPGTTAPGSTGQVTRPGASATVSGTGFLVSSETKIFADEITNSLVILAIPADYAFIEETIKKIDVVQRQVVIEGLLVRVDITDNLDFGMQWAIQNNLTIKGLTNRDVNIAGPLTLNTPLSDPVGSPSMFQFAAFDLAGKVKLALQALATQGKAKILASPHILVSDNREARIQVGQQVPLATSTTTTPLSSTSTTTPAFVNTSTSTIQYKDIGIILKVKPQINDSGLVSLEVTQEVSSLGANVSIAGQAFASINKTEATTNLVAQDGETIIIGGLIREDTNRSRSGIPFLSRIPVLGYLFGSTTDDTTRAELIILLTPRVVRNIAEAGGVTSDYVEKYKGVAKDKSIDQFLKEKSRKEKSEGSKKENGGKADAQVGPSTKGAESRTSEKGPETPVRPLPEVKPEDEARQFVDQYISAYESGDIDKFMSLYSTAAVENNSLLYEDIRRAYQEGFRGTRYKYELSNIQARKGDAGIILTGAFVIKKTAGEAVSQGNITWTLIRENGALKIIRADYK
ncbi:MAG TPA: secretin N-terminal domain-containing protein [Thermodesulfovibrionales bacterium]|nr:secretin N-terminal domain-containing protein [Thermodesulfovibrionales bacterium]